MIVLGSIVAVLGIISYIYGNNMNNDLDKQFEYFLHNSKSNPGDIFTIAGIVLIVVGTILVAVGLYLYFRRVNNKLNYSPDGLQARKNVLIMPTKIAVAHEKDSEGEMPVFCRICGSRLSSDSVFCEQCGTKVKR